MKQRYNLPREGEVVAVGEKVFLGVIRKDEKEKYLAISYTYSCFKGWFSEETFVNSLWGDFISDSAFVCSIYQKGTGEYLGYCSVKNLAKEEWEMAIELKPEECHKGYGTEALSFLMNKLYCMTGRRYFYARVEIENYASQGLMKKLGAVPNGIREFLLHGEEITRFQNEYKDAITDEIRAVASEFGMEAEEILGYILEYRFDFEK